MVKNCVMCNVKLKEAETSVYSCKKCYNKYAFWTISEAKAEAMKKEEEEEEAVLTPELLSSMLDDDREMREEMEMASHTAREPTPPPPYSEEDTSPPPPLEELKNCEVCDKVKTSHSGYYTSEGEAREGFVCGTCFIDCYSTEEYTETEALDSLKSSGWTWPPNERCLIGECDCEGDEREFCDGYGTQ